MLILQLGVLLSECVCTIICSSLHTAFHLVFLHMLKVEYQSGCIVCADNHTMCIQVGYSDGSLRLYHVNSGQ